MEYVHLARQFLSGIALLAGILFLAQKILIDRANSGKSYSDQERLPAWNMSAIAGGFGGGILLLTPEIISNWAWIGPLVGLVTICLGALIIANNLNPGRELAAGVIISLIGSALFFPGMLWMLNEGLEWLLSGGPINLVWSLPLFWWIVFWVWLAIAVGLVTWVIFGMRPPARKSGDGSFGSPASTMAGTEIRRGTGLSAGGSSYTASPMRRSTSAPPSSSSSYNTRTAATPLPVVRIVVTLLVLSMYWVVLTRTAITTRVVDAGWLPPTGIELTQ